MLGYDGGGMSYFFFSSTDNGVANNTKWYCNELYFSNYFQNDGILTTKQVNHFENYIEFYLHENKTPPPFNIFDPNYVKDKFYILWRPYQH